VQQLDLIELFVRPLNELGLKYMVSGSVAAMLYGEPRVTHDIDFVVFLREGDVKLLRTAYPDADFYVPPPEVITIEMARARRDHFNVIHPDSALKADFYITNRDELEVWAFRKTQKYSAGDLVVTLAPPEYVIVRKFEFYREGGSDKHLRDIRGMLAVSDDQIDRSELREWIERRGLQAEWGKIEG